ncbi:MAG: thymidine phosphorylase [Gemmatimonadetes bacterium]|nr:thymidine phosphorylase [Gemmatimonadota bacterium]
MIPARLIQRKRSGETLSGSDIERFFGGYLVGEVADYQMSAFLMAVYFNGLAAGELDALVGVMLGSGATLDLSALPEPKVDKHSTGGVGDKVSLPLAPLAAELGVRVPMMSGRGLGHTGGTLDKLEAIPGFRTDLPLSRFVEVLDECGCAMTGQTAEIAPLDRRLYDLRNATGTVESLPLIASSIMSKKLAEGLTALVLDVKVGEGAFLPEEGSALDLARTMVAIGEARGVRTVALLTAMDRPLGRALGNALEVRESLDCLRGGGPADLRELTLALAAEMAVRGGAQKSLQEARERATSALDDGRALERFARMVRAQGGDVAVIERPERLPRAEVVVECRAPRSGVVEAVVPRALGWGVVELGGGRRALGDAVHPGVGFVLRVAPGDRVEDGDVLGEVHARSAGDAERGREILSGAVAMGEGPARLRPLVSHRVTQAGVEAL